MGLKSDENFIKYYKRMLSTTTFELPKIQKPISMLTKFKLNAILVITILSLLTASYIVPNSRILGKHYDNSMDFTCCKGDQLYIHHYYTKNVFFVEMASGYTVEPIGKPSPDGCNIQCGE